MRTFPREKQGFVKQSCAGRDYTESNGRAEGGYFGVIASMFHYLENYYRNVREAFK